MPKKKTLDDVVSVLEKMDGRLAGIEEALGAQGAQFKTQGDALGLITSELKGLHAESIAVSAAVTLMARDYDVRLRRVEAAVFPKQH